MTNWNGSPRTDLKLAPLAPLAANGLWGKRVAVVGGTGGLGQALAKQMAGLGATVTVVGQTFRDAGVPNLKFERADLSSMAEAVRIGKLLPADLDVVVLTTGIIAAPKREETPEGLERDLAVSYLSRLALLRELAPRLKAGTRIFVMGMPGSGTKGDFGDLNAERAYESMAVHLNTVAGNEALVLEGQRRWPSLAFFGLNPGLIKTNIRANVLGGAGSLKQRLAESMIGLFTISAEKYAKRLVPAVFAPELERHAPVFFNQKAEAITGTDGLTGEHARAFVAASEVLLDRALSRRV